MHIANSVQTVAYDFGIEGDAAKATQPLVVPGRSCKRPISATLNVIKPS
jgi:hypothetical protein